MVIADFEVFFLDLIKAVAAVCVLGKAFDIVFLHLLIVDTIFTTKNLRELGIQLTNRSYRVMWSFKSYTSWDLSSEMRSRSS